MSGPSNYREANALLENGCDYGCPHTGCQHEMACLARAQVHATLALAAATALSGLGATSAADLHEWKKATDEDYDAEQAAEVTR